MTQIQKRKLSFFLKRKRAEKRTRKEKFGNIKVQRIKTEQKKAGFRNDYMTINKGA